MIATKAVGAVKAGARPSSYTGQNRVPAILALWFVLVLIAAARNRKLPDQKHMVALGVATLVIAAAAAIAPKLVFYLLVGLALVVAASNSDVLVSYIDSGSAKLRGSFA